MTDHDAWLAQVTEETIEPERPIVDPHHHLWHHKETPYLLPDLWTDTGSGHNIEQTVFIDCTAEYRTSGPEAMRPVGETEFVVKVAAEAAKGPAGAARIGAIIGHADLMLGGAVDEVLAAHEQAGNGLFRGIRHAAGWDDSEVVRNSHSNPPEHLYAEPAFREGMAELNRHGMVFEAWHYHRQISELTDLARALPETTIVHDHFGGPLGIGPYKGKRDEIFAQWKTDISALAQCPNVAAKLGGMAMAINGFGWHKGERPLTSDELVAVQWPWYQHCIEQFGPERCMFESNYPVDKVSISYNVLWNAFKKMTAEFSAGEKESLFRATAMRIYRLPPLT
jgi:L-fuconolactonase